MHGSAHAAVVYYKGTTSKAGSKGFIWRSPLLSLLCGFRAVEFSCLAGSRISVITPSWGAVDAESSPG